MNRLLLCFFLVSSLASAQQLTVQYREQFDSVIAPNLPAGWASTTNRSAAGDFITSTSSARSAPHTVLSSNATITQSLTSPLIDLSGLTPTRLEFYTARSSSHTAGLIVEASLDDGISFPILLSDTIRNPGTSSYLLTSLPLQPGLGSNARVRFRWRLIGASGAGTSGTFRLDDVTLLGQARFDLALSNLRTSQAEPAAGQSVTLTATIKNLGTSSSHEYKVKFYRDLNGNRHAEENEVFSESDGETISPADSTVISAFSPSINVGENLFIATVALPQDHNPFNDSATVAIRCRAERGMMVLNEVMYDPLTDHNEWIELYHRGSLPVDLCRWSISDRPTSSGVNTFSFTSNPSLVQPGSFIVIAADSTILSRFPHLRTPEPFVHVLILNRASGFGFNNDGDCVILHDAYGTTIDSVAYLPSWHHPDISDPKGRSLERISPDMPSNDKRNWSTSPSAFGGTPGVRNGIYTTSLPTTATLSIHPNPFSPDGDGFEDFCIIRFNLPLATSLIRISVFDLKGRLVRTLANAELSGPQGEIVWDGRDDSNQRVRLGPYVLLLEGIDGRAGILATSKAVVVVAAKL
jgi:hypothetical protein